MKELDHSYSLSQTFDIPVGRYTSIAGGVMFHSDDNHPWVTDNKAVSNFPFKESCQFDYIPCSGKGRIEVGSDVWVGEGTRILSGVHIGDGSILGAGSVVTKDVPPYAIVVGNPGRIVDYRFPHSVIKKLLKVKWWNWDDKTVRERLGDMKDINIFIEKYG